MQISSSKAQEYTRRIMRARMMLMSRNGFYGLLLMHMKFALNEEVGTAATDGERMFFAPPFLDEISDRELVFIMQHEILHVVLRHCFRTGGRDDFLFNVACDIVVNSTILESSGNDIRSITLSKYGESMHLTPDGKEGCNYTAEEVYEMLKSSGQPWQQGLAGQVGVSGNSGNSGKQGQARRPGKKGRSGVKSGRSGKPGQDGQSGPLRVTDNHSRWGTSKANGLTEEWEQRIRDAIESSGSGRGTIPKGLRREIDRLLNPITDWRTVLNDFVQEEITDYSFTPPDRRFADSPFFLPDFNEKNDTVRNILFMIDTSGSMSKDQITQAYSEIKGAIDQYDGRLAGWLGFFDAEVIEPKPFEDETEFKDIKPYGGGGTSFEAIFEYVRSEMAGMEITAIIIMTDGIAPFPDRTASMGIPVLWMINNEEVDPPWGKTVRI